MSQLKQLRHVRLYGPPFALHDVRDVEAHVRTLLDAYLREHGARLDAPKYEDALTYLVEICWKLSGLQGDRRTPRFDHFAEILMTVDAIDETFRQELGPFPSRERAESTFASWRSCTPADTVVVTYVARRPRGAYDPSRGLSFSTYSRRVLKNRCVDWYRKTFGDSRYGGHLKPLSLDGLVEQWETRNDGSGADESYLDHKGPGARLDFIDELNRHAYYDPFEERETRSITDPLGGTDRVAAAG